MRFVLVDLHNSGTWRPFCGIRYCW